MTQRISEIVERFEPVGVELIRIRAGDTYPLPEVFEDLSDEDIPERFRRYRQAVLDREAGKAEIDDLIARTERAITRQAR